MFFGGGIRSPLFLTKTDMLQFMVGFFLRVEAWKFQAYEKGPTSQSDLP